LASRDAVDTQLGSDADLLATMPYYRLLFELYAESEADTPPTTGGGGTSEDTTKPPEETTTPPVDTTKPTEETTTPPEETTKPTDPREISTMTVVWKDALSGEIYDTWFDVPIGYTLRELSALPQWGTEWIIPEPSFPLLNFVGFRSQDGVWIVRDGVINWDFVVEPDNAGDLVAELVLGVEGIWEPDWSSDFVKIG